MMYYFYFLWYCSDAIAMPPPTPLAIGTPSIYGIDSPPSNSDGQPDSPEISLTVPQVPTTQQVNTTVA